jgi:hypothetical protein
MKFINESLTKLNTQKEDSKDKHNFNEDWKKIKSNMEKYKTNSEQNYKDSVIGIYKNLLEVIINFNINNQKLFKQLITLGAQTPNPPNPPNPPNGYVSISNDTISLKTNPILTNEVLNEKLAPILLELMNNCINISNFNKFAVRVVVDIIFGLLVAYNNVTSKFNLPMYKYEVVKQDFLTSDNGENMIKFVFIYLEFLNKNIDFGNFTVDNLNTLFALSIQPMNYIFPSNPDKILDKFEKLSIFIDSPKIKLDNRNLLDHIKVLNPNYFKELMKFIITIFTKRLQPLTTNYDNSRLIHIATKELFYGSNIFELLLANDSDINIHKYVGEDFKKLAIQSRLNSFVTGFKNIFQNSQNVLIGGAKLIIKPKTIKIYSSNTYKNKQRVSKKYTIHTKKPINPIEPIEPINKKFKGKLKGTLKRPIQHLDYFS